MGKPCQAELSQLHFRSRWDKGRPATCPPCTCSTPTGPGAPHSPPAPDPCSPGFQTLLPLHGCFPSSHPHPKGDVHCAYGGGGAGFPPSPVRFPFLLTIDTSNMCRSSEKDDSCAATTPGPASSASASSQVTGCLHVSQCLSEIRALGLRLVPNGGLGSGLPAGPVSLALGTCLSMRHPPELGGYQELEGTQRSPQWHIVCQPMGAPPIEASVWGRPGCSAWSSDPHSLGRKDGLSSLCR